MCAFAGPGSCKVQSKCPHSHPGPRQGPTFQGPTGSRSGLTTTAGPEEAGQGHRAWGGGDPAVQEGNLGASRDAQQLLQIGWEHPLGPACWVVAQGGGSAYRRKGAVVTRAEGRERGAPGECVMRSQGRGTGRGRGCVGDQNRGARPDHNTATGSADSESPVSPQLPRLPPTDMDPILFPGLLGAGTAGPPSVALFLRQQFHPGCRLLFGCKSLSLTRTQSSHLYNGVLGPTLRLMVGEAHGEH